MFLLQLLSHEISYTMGKIKLERPTGLDSSAAAVPLTKVKFKM